MPTETYNLILVLAAGVITGLLYVNHKQSLSLRDALPPAFTPLIPVFLNTITDLASTTPSTLDDEFVAKIKELLANPPPA